MRPQKVIIGALAGLAAGALIGVLFAPDKGSESRGKIAKKSGDVLDSVRSTFNSFLDGISTKFDRVKDEVEDIADGRKSRETRREMHASAS
jgi:gas vesicle protein